MPHHRGRKGARKEGKLPAMGVWEGAAVLGTGLCGWSGHMPEPGRTVTHRLRPTAPARGPSPGQAQCGLLAFVLET